MPGSPTTPGCSGACVSALDHVAFRRCDSVGARNIGTFAVQWLAYTLPYRRFADTLADACARLGADVVRYSFIVMDLHLLLLAGLPAHRIIAFITDAPACARCLRTWANPPRRHASPRSRGPPMWEMPESDPAVSTPTPSPHRRTNSINGSPGNPDRRPPSARRRAAACRVSPGA